MIKLLIGGSPCTHWSIAQKNNRETEPEGLGWELFKNYLIAKEKFKPDFFLYENNKSAAQAIKDQIAHELDVDLMHINSALVSAQNRQRFYAFNWEVDQPEDRGIVLRDILEQGYPFGRTNERAYALTATYWKGQPREKILTKAQRTMVAEPVGAIWQYPRGNNPGGVKYDKAPTLTANGSWVYNNLSIDVVAAPVAEPVNVTADGKAKCLRACYYKDGVRNLVGKNVDRKTCVAVKIVDLFLDDEDGYYFTDDKGKRVQVYEVKNGLITIKGKQYPIKLADGHYIIRKLTPVECERLQTLPDGYTKAVSDAQRYKGLGNGWTAEVIIHILNGALKDVPRDEEIVALSMYDGIGTGRYCLDKMGFKNVRYYAYEIDKYAKQVAMSNYPDIIQMGDAFDLRKDDWNLEVDT